MFVRRVAKVDGGATSTVTQTQITSVRVRQEMVADEDDNQPPSKGRKKTPWRHIKVNAMACVFSLLTFFFRYSTLFNWIVFKAFAQHGRVKENPSDVKGLGTRLQRQIGVRRDDRGGLGKKEMSSLRAGNGIINFARLVEIFRLIGHIKW